MDKAVMKKLFAADGLPIVPYHTLLRPDWQRDSQQSYRALSSTSATGLRQPANLGSSVGISKARNEAELVEAVALALQYDRKVVVEAAVPQRRARSNAPCSATTIRKPRCPVRSSRHGEVLRLRSQVSGRRGRSC
jgi:D-alanine-D-alanine ligase-like ATP-grasp enzyme